MGLCYYAYVQIPGCYQDNIRDRVDRDNVPEMSIAQLKAAPSPALGWVEAKVKDSGFAGQHGYMKLEDPSGTIDVVTIDQNPPEKGAIVRVLLRHKEHLRSEPTGSVNSTINISPIYILESKSSTTQQSQPYLPI